MNIYKTVFSLVSCIWALTLSAQPQLPAKVEAKLPELLAKGHPYEEYLNSEFRSGVNSKWGQKQSRNEFWVAYSDRDNNTTFMSPSVDSQNSPKKLGTDG